MAAATATSNENNTGKIKYEVATVIVKRMLKAKLITQDEFERIDAVNKEKFGVLTA